MSPHAPTPRILQRFIPLGLMLALAAVSGACSETGSEDSQMPDGSSDASGGLSSTGGVDGSGAGGTTAGTGGTDLGSGAGGMGTGGATQGTGGSPPSGGAGGTPANGGGTATGGVANGVGGSGGFPPASGGGSGGDLGSSGGTSGDGSSTAGSGGSDGGTGGTGGETFSPCPTVGSPCVVLPLGDSITEGFGSSGGGYRVELFRQAVQAGHDITFVGSLSNGPSNVDGTPFPKNHEGHGGYTIESDGGHSGIAGSITDSALTQYSPDIVLLMIGTNDINGNVDVQNAPARLGTLVDDIINRAPDSLLVVATIIPIRNSDNTPKVPPYNDGVRELVSQRAAAGKHVILVDHYEVLSAEPNWETSLMNDNLHPNDAGYAVLGKAFYETIADALR